MNGSEDVRQFLMSRRAHLTPERADIAVHNEDRRVPGLLTDVEREHLFDLARNLRSAIAASVLEEDSSVRASLRGIVDNLSVPAIIQTPQLDLVATNALRRTLFAPVFEDPRGNFARFKLTILGSLSADTADI